MISKTEAEMIAADAAKARPNIDVKRRDEVIIRFRFPLSSAELQALARELRDRGEEDYVISDGDRLEHGQSRESVGIVLKLTRS